MIMNKVCEVEDFTSPELTQIFHTCLPKPPGAPDDWPIGREDRKFWEIAMALLSVQKYVPESQRKRALGVGAGVEATSFILTTMFQQVFATDLYGGNQWTLDAPGSMLSAPEQFAGQIHFAPRRLVVQYMDGRNLRYEDETFDFIYSSSSLEHFGTLAEISASVQEMSRVLRPGGILSISTEYRLSGQHQWLGSSTYLFDERAIEECIIRPSGCEPVDTPYLDISQVTRDNPSNFRQACRELVSGGNRLELNWTRYPHIVLAYEELSWTSVHICLQKGVKSGL